MRRTTAIHEQAIGVHVFIDGRRLVTFAGCDTLGLARDPAVIAAASQALTQCGVSASASRTTTGTWRPHVQLEAALAAWFETESAVLLPSGWSAPTAVAQALAFDCDVVLLDDGAHPALQGAATFTGLPVRRFTHFDVASARALLAAGERPLILVCALDMHIGRSAPCEALHALAVETDGRLLVDDAHGVGVLGPRGHGVTPQAQGRLPRLHLAGSLAKAVGAHGGFTVGDHAFCDAVRERAAAYTGGTPIPPAVAAAAVAALEIIRSDAARAERVLEHADRLADALRSRGWRVPAERLPWCSIDDFDAEVLARASRRMADAGFLVPHLRYPGSPSQGLLRITLSAAHTIEQVDALVVALDAALR